MLGFQIGRNGSESVWPPNGKLFYQFSVLQRYLKSRGGGAGNELPGSILGCGSFGWEEQGALFSADGVLVLRD